MSPLYLAQYMQWYNNSHPFLPVTVYTPITGAWRPGTVGLNQDGEEYNHYLLL